MLVYYGIVAALIFVNSALNKIQCNKNDARKIFLVISFILLFYFSAFRDFSVGTDTLQFVESYKTYSKYGIEIVGFGQVYEPGYMFLIWVLTRITDNPRFLIILTAAFINFSILTFIGRYSKNYFLSTLIYILSCQYLVSMCMLRQFLAISIILLGFGFVIRKKYVRFLIITFLAAMFHYFSISLLVLVPIYEIKHISIVWKVILVAIFCIIYLFLPSIVLFLITHIKNYNDYLIYLEEMGELQGGFRIPPMLLIWLALMFPLILNYRIWSRSSNILSSRGVNWKFMHILYLFLFALILLAGRMGIFTRVYYYFTIFLVLLPNIQDINHNNKWDVYMVVMLLAIFTVALILDRGTYGAADYKFMKL